MNSYDQMENTNESIQEPDDDPITRWMIVLIAVLVLAGVLSHLLK